MTADLPRRLLAEAVGTALLVLFGSGSVLAALTLGDGELDFAGLGMVALAFGLVIAVAIYAFGTTPGAHINPAVSVALAATGRFPWAEVPAFDVIARPRLVEQEPPQGAEGDIRARRVTREEAVPAAAGRQGTEGAVSGRRR